MGGPSSGRKPWSPIVLCPKCLTPGRLYRYERKGPAVAHFDGRTHFINPQRMALELVQQLSEPTPSYDFQNPPPPQNPLIKRYVEPVLKDPRLTALFEYSSSSLRRQQQRQLKIYALKNIVELLKQPKPARYQPVIKPPRACFKIRDNIPPPAEEPFYNSKAWNRLTALRRLVEILKFHKIFLIVINGEIWTTDPTDTYSIRLIPIVTVGKKIRVSKRFFDYHRTALAVRRLKWITNKRKSPLYYTMCSEWYIIDASILRNVPGTVKLNKLPLTPLEDFLGWYTRGMGL